MWQIEKKRSMAGPRAAFVESQPGWPADSVKSRDETGLLANRVKKGGWEQVHWSGLGKREIDESTGERFSERFR